MNTKRVIKNIISRARSTLAHYFVKWAWLLHVDAAESTTSKMMERNQFLFFKKNAKRRASWLSKRYQSYGQTEVPTWNNAVDDREWLAFVVNYLRLPLGVDPSVSNMDREKILLAFDKALKEKLK